MGRGGRGRCERRREVYVNIKKKMGGLGGRVGWDQGRCVEVGLGVRVDVNEQLKFL